MIGAPDTNRTCDLPLRRGLLYPLSYRGARRDFTRMRLFLISIAGDRIKGDIRISDGENSRTVPWIATRQP